LSTYVIVRKEYIKEDPQYEAHFCNCNTPPEELTIDHKMVRIGYAIYKRRIEIPLLLDKDTFVASCGPAHR